MGKLGTHQYDGCSHIPLIACHPTEGHGERRQQLVQLVDLYPTVLEGVGRPLPPSNDAKPLHGISLLPLFSDADSPTRDCALMGMFGKSVSITDGDWTLHQSPVATNQPLYWHGYHIARFIDYDLGPFSEGCRRVKNCRSWDQPTTLNNRRDDPSESTDVSHMEPKQLLRMQALLRDELVRLCAPEWQTKRLGL